MDTQKSLYSSFLALPQPIKDWLSSDQISYLIQEIIDRLGIKGERTTIIPRLILRLAVKDLDPQYFINELANELGISFQSAKTITEDIESRVLRPIENELKRDFGIDIKVIRFGQPHAEKSALAQPLPAQQTTKSFKEFLIPGPGRTSPDLSGQEKTKPMEPIVDLRSFQIKKGGVKPKPAEAESEALPAAPFMLHQADQITQTALPAQTNAAESQRIKPGLNIKIPIFSRPMAEKPAAPKPISVKIEIPQSARVVHYSDFRTPISQDGAPKPPAPTTENIVDLRKIIKQETNANTVDLRDQSQ